MFCMSLFCSFSLMFSLWCNHDGSLGIRNQLSVFNIFFFLYRSRWKMVSQSCKEAGGAAAIRPCQCGEGRRGSHHCQHPSIHHDNRLGERGDSAGRGQWRLGDGGQRWASEGFWGLELWQPLVFVVGERWCVWVGGCLCRCVCVFMFVCVCAHLVSGLHSLVSGSCWALFMIYTAALTCSHILFTQSFITSSSHTHRASFPVLTEPPFLFTELPFLFSHSLISSSHTASFPALQSLISCST